jgi:hypothetical protein
MRAFWFFVYTAVGDFVGGEILRDQLKVPARWRIQQRPSYEPEGREFDSLRARHFFKGFKQISRTPGGFAYNTGATVVDFVDEKSFRLV